MPLTSCEDVAANRVRMLQRITLTLPHPYYLSLGCDVSARLARDSGNHREIHMHEISLSHQDNL
jgi:hypothetical protein